MIALVACGGEPECVDGDRDGFGEACAAGPDCDDTNPLRIDNCELVPPPDCSRDPLAAGCPCLPGGSSDCYPGAAETVGVGLCQAGRTRCINRFWGICEGSVSPGFERCDELDNDCDGAVDEGVLSPCGACTPGCIGSVWGDDAAPFEARGDLELTERGELTLRREVTLSSTLWIANSAEGTISKIDTRSATEVGRYATGGQEPSRVAVDYFGDAWVANREFGSVSSVTKIAGELERCVDRDGSDSIETSDGVNVVDGDECVLLRVDVGEPEGVARALAIDGNLGLDGISGGDVWVGLHDQEAVVQLDGLTGDVRDQIETPGFSPYMAAFDPWGTLWMISRDGLLASIDRRAAVREAVVVEVPLDCFLLYGLAIDVSGRLALTGFGCDRVTTYEPARQLWQSVATPPSVRGAVMAVGELSASAESGSELWVAHTAAQVTRLRLHPLEVLETIDLAGEGALPIETIGIGLDAQGNVWAASSQSDLDTGVATRIDVESAVTAQVPVGLGPHTQGDLTGAKRLGGFVEEGAQSHVFAGCGFGGTQWLNVHLGASPGATGTILVEARRAENEGQLNGAEFVELGVYPEDPLPYGLDFEEGGVVEVRVTLRTSARDGAPRLERLGLEWTCPGPG